MTIEESCQSDFKNRLLSHTVGFHSKTYFAQSARAVEYTDCTSAEGYDPTQPKKFPGYDTKQSDVEVPVMLELWGMQSTPFCHRSQVHSGPEW